MLSFKALLITSISLLMMTAEAYSFVKVGLSGSSSTSNFSLETHRSSSISANISVSLSKYIQLGLTHRRSFEKKSGLKRAQVDTDTFVYNPFEDNTESITNSVDLTVILYHGVISPFVFGDVAKRDYFTEIEYLDSRIKSTTTLYPVPNYGFGVAILLSRSFQLRITQTVTPGVKTEIVEGEEKNFEVKDSYTQVGITYKI